MASTDSSRRLSIEVTKRCNSSCIHCFAGASENDSTEIAYEVLKNIIIDGADAGYRHLHLTGGEPLLYENIFEVIDTALEKGYQTILLNTNGMLLNGRMCQKLAQYPELTISVSLEGSEVLHDYFRGNGTYQRAIKGLETGLEAGLEVIIFTIVCKSLLPELPRFADQLFTSFQGIKYLTLIRPIDSAPINSIFGKELLSPDEFLNLVRAISLLNLYGRPTTLLTDPLINVVARMLAISWIPESKELHQQGNLMVMADRSLSVSHTSDAYCGQYGSASIENVLSYDPYRQAVAPDKLICPACQYAQICHDNGLLRPVDGHALGPIDSHFCKAVLDLVST